MLSRNRVEKYIQKLVKECKDNDCNTLEIYNICDIPIELLTIEEERIVNDVLYRAIPENVGYSSQTSIKQYFLPDDIVIDKFCYLVFM